MVKFSLGVPDSSLLPVAKLNKAMIQALHSLPANGTGYEELLGSEDLRRQIALGAAGWGCNIKLEDLVTTAGCMNAIAYSLLAITKPGDTIAVESPVYFGILRFAKSIGLQVLELPTDPDTGIDPDEVKAAIERHPIKAVFVVSNFSNPLGHCMPEEQKKALVRLLAHHGIPLIEDDIYADLYFGNKRPTSCKLYDEEGNVLWCNSVSKTLAPGYRVGWVSGGKYTEPIKRQSSTTALHLPRFSGSHSLFFSHRQVRASLAQAKATATRQLP